MRQKERKIQHTKEYTKYSLTVKYGITNPTLPKYYKMATQKKAQQHETPSCTQKKHILN